MKSGRYSQGLSLTTLVLGTLIPRVPLWSSDHHAAGRSIAGHEASMKTDVVKDDILNAAYLWCVTRVGSGRLAMPCLSPHTLRFILLVEMTKNWHPERT